MIRYNSSITSLHFNGLCDLSYLIFTVMSSINLRSIMLCQVTFRNTFQPTSTWTKHQPLATTHTSSLRYLDYSASYVQIISNLDTHTSSLGYLDYSASYVQIILNIDSYLVHHISYFHLVPSLWYVYPSISPSLFLQLSSFEHESYWLTNIPHHTI